MVIFIFISFLIYFVFSQLKIRLNDILIFLIIIVFFYVMLKSNSRIFYNYIKEKDVKLKFEPMSNISNLTNVRSGPRIIAPNKELLEKLKQFNYQQLELYFYLDQLLIDSIGQTLAWQELIDIIKECSIMVKGSDYVGKPIVGAEYCKEIKFFNRINEYSTTNKIQHIINR
jgi:hypothetical protein